jgi:hypothetical protein
VVWCVDTSAWIDAVRFYNPGSKLFAQLWEYLEGEAIAGRLVSPQAVYDELKDKQETKDHPLFAEFVGRVRATMFLQPTEAIQARMTALVNAYPNLTRKGKPFAKSDGDAWVIAQAAEMGAAVVSSESPKPAAQVPYKIPDVCRAEGLTVLQLPEFLNDIQGLARVRTTDAEPIRPRGSPPPAIVATPPPPEEE